MANNSSRLINTSKNVFTGFLNQLISLVFSFASRTVFIYYLGIEYLGINGLFANILQVLSMADLGFNTAMVYSMYKPLKDDDHEMLAALMSYYKKIYNIIACVVFGIGILIIPVLPYIVVTDKEIPNLTIYYVLYLMNTVVSYLCIYKTSITSADQKSYLLNNYDSLFIIIRNVLQILALVIFKNFLVYLTIQIVISFVSNLYKAKKSEKLYPYINNKIELDNSVKKDIFNNVKSMFLYKIGGVLLNNTSNIMISIMVGTIYVGYYSNYLLVINAVMTFTNLVFNSMTASIGNINVSADLDKRLEIFNRVNFVAIWIFSFCGICFYILFQDFITLWLGAEFLLDKKTLIAIVLNFVIPGTIRTVSLYRDTNGMFHKTKYIFFVTAIINLILSLILGKFFGLLGILISSVIARLLTNVWFEPFVLFKDFFNLNPWKHYFIKQIKYWVVFIVLMLGVELICSFLGNTTIISFLLKIIICIIVPNTVMMIVYHKKDEFVYLKSIVNKVLMKLKNKKSEN